MEEEEEDEGEHEVRCGGGVRGMRERSRDDGQRKRYDGRDWMRSGTDARMTRTRVDCGRRRHALRHACTRCSQVRHYKYVGSCMSRPPPSALRSVQRPDGVCMVCKPSGKKTGRTFWGRSMAHGAWSIGAWSWSCCCVVLRCTCRRMQEHVGRWGWLVPKRMATGPESLGPRPINAPSRTYLARHQLVHLQLCTYL